MCSKTEIVQHSVNCMALSHILAMLVVFKQIDSMICMTFWSLCVLKNNVGINPSKQGKISPINSYCTHCLVEKNQMSVLDKPSLLSSHERCSPCSEFSRQCFHELLCTGTTCWEEDPTILLSISFRLCVCVHSYCEERHKYACFIYHLMSAKSAAIGHYHVALWTLNQEHSISPYSTKQEN
jgi:hypothetical protein